MMNDMLRIVLAGSVLLTGACGIFGDDEERLEGERIPVRDYRSVVTGAPAAPAPAAVEAVPEEQSLQ